VLTSTNTLIATYVQLNLSKQNPLAQQGPILCLE